MSLDDTVVSWLHLTDLHVGMGDQDWLWPRMKDKFIRDLEKIYAVSGPWDLVFFSGDLAQKGSEEEYLRLDEVLSEIWSCFDRLGCHPLLLAVPGNHDLSRPADIRSKPVLRMLEGWHAEDGEVRNDFWNEEAGNPYRDLVGKAFSQYDAWWARTPYRPQRNIKSGILPGDFSFTFEKDNLRLGIVGLNSAFLQLTGKNDYKGRLVVHPRQCSGVVPKSDYVSWAQSHDICFFMTHHPMGWLHTNSRRTFYQEVMESFAVHLCGHQHETEVHQILSGGSDTAPLHWIGRSLFGLEMAENGIFCREHGYVAGWLSQEGDTLNVQFMPRRREEQGLVWSLVPDAKGVALPDDRCTRLFSMSRSPSRISPCEVSRATEGSDIFIVSEQKEPKSRTTYPLSNEVPPEMDGEDQSIQDTDTRLQQAINEMAAEIEKSPHLHWAFSVAWAESHPLYEGIHEGRFANARDIAEAFLVSLRTYDACSLADVAHEALVKRKSLSCKVLEDAEPEKDDMSRYKAASDMVDLILRSLSKRQYDDAAAARAKDKNHEVTVRAKEESAAELCASGLDKRLPKFLPLKKGTSILRSEYQVPKAPPGGIDLEGELSAQHVAEDLGKMLISEYGTFLPGQPNNKLWEALKSELWHLCKKKTGEDRGRYFLVFADTASFDKHTEQVSILKDKLDWLRFFVLDSDGIENDDSYRPLNDILLRHQQNKETLHASSKE